MDSAVANVLTSSPITPATPVSQASDSGTQTNASNLVIDPSGVPVKPFVDVMAGQLKKLLFQAELKAHLKPSVAEGSDRATLLAAAETLLDSAGKGGDELLQALQLQLNPSSSTDVVNLSSKDQETQQVFANGSDPSTLGAIENLLLLMGNKPQAGDKLSTDEVAEGSGKKLPEKGGRKKDDDTLTSISKELATEQPLIAIVATASPVKTDTKPQTVTEGRSALVSDQNNALVTVAASKDLKELSEGLASKVGLQERDVKLSPLNTIDNNAPVPTIFSGLLEKQIQKSPVGEKVELNIQSHVASSQWGSGLAEKVVWMVGNQHQGADLHLNPPSLGPLEVNVKMSSDGQASLTFTTAHAEVRDALETATPKLREMLGDSGISLGNVSVNVGNFSQHQAATRDNPQNGRRNDVEDASVTEISSVSAGRSVTSVRALRDGAMVDLFA